MKFRKLLLVATIMAVSSVSVFAAAPTESDLSHSTCSHSLDVQAKTEEHINNQQTEKNGRSNHCPLYVEHKYTNTRYHGIQRDKIFHGGTTGNCTITTTYKVYTKECPCGANNGRTYRVFDAEHHSGC